MIDYKEMYFQLAGNVADVIEILDNLSENLKNIQYQNEESFLDGHEILSAK